MAQPIRIMEKPYLFIDGAYFREAYRAVMSRFYGTVPDVNYDVFWNVFSNPTRIYYYDAVDRNRIGDETTAQRDARVSALNTFHAYLNSLSGWHVREGFVSRGRRASRRTQKAVDIQLAVDALEHAVAHNMSYASFILGDLDFEPLFFSLNRFGVIVTVYFEPGTASQELLEVADQRAPMTLSQFTVLAVPEFRQANIIPEFSVGAPAPNQMSPVRQGTWNGRQACVYLDAQAPRTLLWAEQDGTDSSRQVAFNANDPAKVELAFTMEYGGEITWAD
jgi:uncharacterized LabA/DUF88 family protein